MTTPTIDTPCVPPAASTKTVTVWRLVDKDGKKAPPTAFSYEESDGDTQRRAAAEDLDLKGKLKLADSFYPEGAPHRYDPFVAEVRLTNAQRMAEHWKSNHDNQVERARVLLERPDLPLERVRAYRTIGRLQDENSALRNASK